MGQDLRAYFKSSYQVNIVRDAMDCVNKTCIIKSDNRDFLNLVSPYISYTSLIKMNCPLIHWINRLLAFNCFSIIDTKNYIFVQGHLTFLVSSIHRVNGEQHWKLWIIQSHLSAYEATEHLKQCYIRAHTCCQLGWCLTSFLYLHGLSLLPPESRIVNANPPWWFLINASKT